MAYAIHSRGFEYNDEYYELNNAASLHKTYANKMEAISAWAKLEREYLDLDLLVREPFICTENNEIFQILFAKLDTYGITFSEKVTTDIANIHKEERCYLDLNNQELQLDKLADEQLLDLLLAVDCNIYRLTEFNPTQDKRYVLQICHPERSYHTQGCTYLTTITYTGYSGIWEVAHPDEFFDSDFFKDIEEFEGDFIATLYQKPDENNPILQSLLAQYAQHFAIKQPTIKQPSDEANGERELHYLGGDMQALRAVNAVLSQPFFHIHELSYDELMQLQEEQNRLQVQRQKQAQSQYINKQYEDNSNHHENKTGSSIWQKVRQWFG